MDVEARGSAGDRHRRAVVNAGVLYCDGSDDGTTISEVVQARASQTVMALAGAVP